MKQENLSDNNSSEFDKLLAESLNNNKLKEGTIVQGVVTEIEDDAVILDISGKVEGRVPKGNLRLRKIIRK